ncbi:hypothetical protein PFISCL1PPCAC_20053, partial [Pristionchus fissidentatus]
EMAGEANNATHNLTFTNSLELIEDDGEMMTGATEEVEDIQLGPLSEFKDGFDAATNDHHHLMIHDLYQPLDLGDGRYTCKICHQSSTARPPLFTSKSQFTSHRYRCHGTFMNLLPCPDQECDLQFASIVALKRHLQTDRNLPLEAHYRHFLNMAEFEMWKATVEQVMGSKFLLHNKQALSKRNVMHCFRSEHKMASCARNRNRMSKMRKPGSACPAHITFIENLTGTIDVVYQLFHFGHDVDEVRLINRPMRGEDDFFSQQDESLSVSTIFPVTNRLPKSAAMQYVQLCLMDMPDSLYLSTRYSQLLVVLDVQSYFIFAKPIPNPRSVSAHVHKSYIVRQMVDMFTQFGCPVGFSVVGSSSVLFESMESIEHVFNVSMTHVGNASPDLNFLRKSILERAVDEFVTEDRWPEVVPFVVYAQNTEGGGNKYLSPFEMMFNRRPPQSHDPQEQLEEAHKTQINAVLGLRFETGDDVLVRFFDPEIIAEGPTRNASQPQPSTEYLNGLVGEVDWYGSPFYPYKVFICRSTEEPNTDCPFIWVSPFDVAPTVIDLRNRRNLQRRNLAMSLLCSCTEDSRGGERCFLPRSELCIDKMARACCEKLERECEYHNEYGNGGGDTYRRVELLSKRFMLREKMEKRRGEDDTRKEMEPEMENEEVVIEENLLRLEREERREQYLPHLYVLSRDDTTKESTASNRSPKETRVSDGPSELIMEEEIVEDMEA